MPLRSRLALAAFGAIAASIVVALLLTNLKVSDEITVMVIGLGVGIPASFTFASLAVTPLERERSMLRERARQELQASVRRFGEALRSTAVDPEEDAEPDVAPLLGVVLETAVAAVGGRRGIVYRYERAHQQLHPVCTVGVSNPGLVHVGIGYAGWVAAHRASLRITGPTSDLPSRAPSEPMETEVIAAPLDSSDGLLGVLIIHGNARGRAFNDDELDTLTSLARQAAVGAENVLLHHEAKRLAVTDALTGISNYRAFKERLSIEFERAIRFGRPLSVLIADSDHLKEINDRFGHQRGDLVLATIAARMTSATRGSIDLVARYGGDEFALILPETDHEGAAAVAEKLRQSVAGTPFAGGEQHVHTSVSVGYATFPMHATTPESLIQAADLALYEAKRAGRNLVRGPRLGSSRDVR
jgi:two-component system, cell cycle response regulator